MKGLGDSRLLRMLNGQRIVDVIFDAVPRGISRADIARLTGLSKPTVSSVVGKLEASKLLRRCPTPPVAGNIGRPAVLYEVVPEAGFVIAGDIGATKTIVGVADLLGNIVTERQFETGPDADSALEALAVAAHEMLTAAGAEAGAACVGVPGVYLPDEDRVERALNLPGFDLLDTRSRLEQLLGVTVHVDNDVNLAVLGEADNADEGFDPSDFAAISVGTGIGMGLIVDGELYSGSTNAAGEIGSMILARGNLADHTTDQPTLTTLEDVASATAICKSFSQIVEAGHASRLTGDADVPEILTAAAQGDPAAGRVLTTAASAMATAVSHLRLIVDPQRVIFGGGVGANPLFVAAVDAELQRMSVGQIEVVASTLGHRATFLGAISQALKAIHEVLVTRNLGEER